MKRGASIRNTDGKTYKSTKLILKKEKAVVSEADANEKITLNKKKTKVIIDPKVKDTQYEVEKDKVVKESYIKVGDRVQIKDPASEHYGKTGRVRAQEASHRLSLTQVDLDHKKGEYDLIQKRHLKKLKESEGHELDIRFHHHEAGTTAYAHLDGRWTKFHTEPNQGAEAEKQILDKISSLGYEPRVRSESANERIVDRIRDILREGNMARHHGGGGKKRQGLETEADGNIITQLRKVKNLRLLEGSTVKFANKQTAKITHAQADKALDEFFHKRTTIEKEGYSNALGESLDSFLDALEGKVRKLEKAKISLGGSPLVGGVREVTLDEGVEHLHFEPVDYHEDHGAGQHASTAGAASTNIKVYRVHHRGVHIGYASTHSTKIPVKVYGISQLAPKTEHKDVEGATYSPAGYPTVMVHGSHLEDLKKRIHDMHSAPPHYLKGKIHPT